MLLTIVIAVSGTLVIGGILILIVRGNYITVISIPMIIIGIGLYLNNLIILVVVILSCLVIFPILIKVIIPKVERYIKR